MKTLSEDNFPELKDKVAIVTGGGRGIGRAVAIALSACGAKVAVFSRSMEQLTQTVALISQRRGSAIAIAGDVTKAEDVAHLLSETARRFGPADILVNNAGSAKAIGPIWKVTPEAWWQDVSVNLKGTFLCTQAILPGMISRHRGRIINVVSRFGIRQKPGDMPMPFASGYSSSKAGVMIFTDLVASTVHELGIRIFALGPGLVRTHMTQQLLQSSDGQKWIPQMQELFDKGFDNPIEQVAQLSTLLASGRADELSGCLIGVGSDVDNMLERALDIRQQGLHVLRYCE